MVPGVPFLDPGCIWLMWSWDPRRQAQEIVGEEGWSSGDHGGKFSLTAWPRDYTPVLGLPQWSRRHANVTLLSWFGCDLLPEMVSPDSVWVKVHKSFLPVGIQACVYLPSLRKFSFLWVGGSGRNETGVVWDYMSFPKGGRAERRQVVLNIKCHWQCASTYPSIHPFIFSIYQVIGSEATKVNITRSGLWETLNKYLLK